MPLVIRKNNGADTLVSKPISPVMQGLATLQEKVTDPIWNTYKQVFPQIDINNPESAQNLAIGVSGGMTNVAKPMLKVMVSKAAKTPILQEIAQKAEPGVIDEMANFTNYVADVKNKVIPPDFNYEANVRDMLAKLELNPNKPNAKIADDLANVLAEGDKLYTKPSSVVPEGGVVYRGTTAGASKKQALLGNGTYVTPDENVAKSFGNDVKKYEIVGNPNLIDSKDPRFLKIKSEAKVITTKDGTFTDGEYIANQVKKLGYDGVNGKGYDGISIYDNKFLKPVSPQPEGGIPNLLKRK